MKTNFISDYRRCQVHVERSVEQGSWTPGTLLLRPSKTEPFNLMVIQSHTPPAILVRQKDVLGVLW